MKGFLHKNENGEWSIKWSDLHSFAQGTIWCYTELHPETNLELVKDKKKVDFEFIADEEDIFNPHKYAKINNKNNKNVTPSTKNRE